MATLYVTHHACIDHDTGDFHPESGDRLRAVQRILEAEDFMLLHRQDAPAALDEHLLRAHPQQYVDHIFQIVPASGHRHIDGDTLISPGSGEAARRAAGGVIVAVDAVLKGEVSNAFVAVRPPGHHAETARAMGFCLFNNVAVGALHARAAHGAERIAVFDWDVHHGNGTQDIFHTDPGLFYASTHEAGNFPNTGFPEERGVANNIVNCPLKPGATGEAFRDAVETTIEPAIRAFKPDLLMISAGFDAHSHDPLSHMRLQVADFVWATQRMMAVADDCCDGRLISVLEGGYDLPSLAGCVQAHVRTLMGV
ncbi:histone deacetylase family protein [Roseospira marina]|uniref:Histone deacetylase family protein n=1 Tax=Roseospira marina TaxID=140057 RepID=A0A5M6IE83_9PROT|nr:histone deacetylase family protein [Roseospira marina]KAA5606089.1 histone deacetylase family protein [Roseospira marina]MBB4313045.1 acetoin utilization deacetylase AcuC-like enzyme [Roseospira marina]MBB5086214.1 acetoin utilization deacetylase AcuC-like enzyme [Roseospira marina]